MSAILVSLSGAGRAYGSAGAQVKAVISASCEVSPGDRIALMGPSGSGKSTLLQIMGGLDTHNSGSVSWPALGAPETLRPLKIGFLFQMPSLIAPLTVVENVELPLLLTRTGVAAARAAALDMLGRLELSGLTGKLPEELSGGQAQRVALARALVCRPRLVLADEPTGQLDHSTASRLLDFLVAYIGETGSALVVATHDPAVAGRMRKVWHMRHGTLEVKLKNVFCMD